MFLNFPAYQIVKWNWEIDSVIGNNERNIYKSRYISVWMELSYNYNKFYLYQGGTICFFWSCKLFYFLSCEVLRIQGNLCFLWIFIPRMHYLSCHSHCNTKKKKSFLHPQTSLNGFECYCSLSILTVTYDQYWWLEYYSRLNNMFYGSDEANWVA